MCRLYGMIATHPTRAECELIDAQNSLIEQAVEDRRGLENPHGWGIGVVRDGGTECARQVEPANSSDDFRQRAIQTEADTLIAHVRRATVGEPLYENTHPFRNGGSFLAHNGHVGRFDDVRPKLLEALPESDRDRIGGTTDSEHFFQLALSHYRETDSRTEALRRAAVQLRDWTRAIGGETELYLNTLWGDDGLLVGTKLERSLWYVEQSPTNLGKRFPTSRCFTSTPISPW
ncbi:MAG: class II glutamine amidotransferase [Bradymonadaceae bacterium]